MTRMIAALDTLQEEASSRRIKFFWGGGNGRHARLFLVCREAWRFESFSQSQFFKISSQNCNIFVI